jgi:hypothetical protein
MVFGTRSRTAPWRGYRNHCRLADNRCALWLSSSSATHRSYNHLGLELDPVQRSDSTKVDHMRRAMGFFLPMLHAPSVTSPGRNSACRVQPLCR